MPANVDIVDISEGWAKNSVNTVIFRRNSVVTHKRHQYVSFYDDQANILLARRNLSDRVWQIKKTGLTGDVEDAHSTISIMVDGDGYLHIAWDQHDDPLRYCRSKEPGSFELTEKMSMTGVAEEDVTYPEFYRLPNGNLLFLYRDGSSGNGNLVMNYYDTVTKTWFNRHRKLIDGGGRQNAYWQAAVDSDGAIHLSWVWRKSWNVATNHDLCYACSVDGGLTWQKSTGQKYTLPITAKTAEYAARIEKRSALINQTSMCADSYGRPYIASYWTPKDSSIPQYHVVYHDGVAWQVKQVTQRNTAFSLKGGGTKRIPMSRPQILVDPDNIVYLVFRDQERDNCVSLAKCEHLATAEWAFRNLTSFAVDMWEPTYDTELWKSRGILHLFVQRVGQGDAETMEDLPPQMVSILEWENLW